MRALAILFALFGGGWLPAQSSLVINELQAANHRTLVMADGDSPDWIELYNPGRKMVELQGMQLSLRDQRHVFTGSLRVAPKGRVLLFCDGRLSAGPEHVGFRLDREGGTLLLIAADRVTILDVFTYPAMPSDVALGRVPDGAQSWSLLEEPTPGQANRMPSGGVTRSIAPAPQADRTGGLYSAPITVVLSAPAGSSIRCTTDGSDPRKGGTPVDGPITLARSTVLRAITTAPGQLASAEMNHTYLIGAATGPALALSVDPADLWADSTGINVDGAFANFSRGGEAWERSAHVQRPGTSALPVGLRISGSGSRGQPKRSFKLYLRDRYASPDSGWAFADGTHCDEVMLRADATPHAFLRNLLMSTLVERFALNVETQPSEVLSLSLNAEPWGLYRLMPPKDAQWLRQRAGVEAVEVLEGPAATPLAGHNTHFLQAREALFAGAPVDSLAGLMHVESLIDLASLDLFTGRADHDLNVRCYRPRQTGGRWRWVLFDMDLWAPAEENTVERLCSSSQVETPYLPQLLDHPELQVLLLARLTALQATVLHPTVAGAVLDSLYRTHAAVMNADHVRWTNEMELPLPAESREALNTHLNARPEHLMQDLASRTGRSVQHVRVEVPPAHQGQVLLDGLPLPEGRQDIRCLSGVPATLELRPAAGHEVGKGRGLKGDGPFHLEDLSRSGPIRVKFVMLAP